MWIIFREDSSAQCFKFAQVMSRHYVYFFDICYVCVCSYLVYIVSPNPPGRKEEESQMLFV